MAKAPKPGSFDSEAQPPSKTTSKFRIGFGGTVLEMPTSIPFKERFAVRAATGLPLGQFWGGEHKLDEDSFVILWWLARRYNGEPRLNLNAVIDTWPDEIDSDDLIFEIVEDDGDEDTDDPEP